MFSRDSKLSGRWRGHWEVKWLGLITGAEVQEDFVTQQNVLIGYPVGGSYLLGFKDI